MKSYYQDEAVTIYHGDCREVLPTLDRVDLVLTDPPYPNLKGGTVVNLSSGVGKRHTNNRTVGTPWGDDLEPLSDAFALSRFGALVFCSFHSVAFVPSVVGSDGCALVTWYQRNAMPPMNNAPHFQTEFVWAFKKDSGLRWKALKTHYDIPRLQAGCMATERFVDRNERATHPAQKPIALIKKLLAIGGDLILDPYCGTGTTLRAAKDLGRKAIGIEIEERYCEIAARRMAQQVLDFATA
jgi:DNA modification methylase